MALKTFVKISDVSNLSDARYCAGMGVDILGFHIDQGDPRSIDPARFKKITEWIAGVGFAGEFSYSQPYVIVETAKYYNLSYLQIPPNGMSQEVIDLDIPIIVELNLNHYLSTENLKEYMIRHVSHVEFFLITAENEESSSFQMDDILAVSENFPILLGFGINKDNINTLLQTSHLKGIALKGGDELEPGFKDYDELAEILEVIEVE